MSDLEDLLEARDRQIAHLVEENTKLMSWGNDRDRVAQLLREERARLVEAGLAMREAGVQLTEMTKAATAATRLSEDLVDMIRCFRDHMGCRDVELKTPGAFDPRVHCSGCRARRVQGRHQMPGLLS